MAGGYGATTVTEWTPAKPCFKIAIRAPAAWARETIPDSNFLPA
jgi:hypothetical protein